MEKVAMVSSDTILIEEEVIEGIPVCSTNYSSPVVEQSNFIDEISYKIGNRKYVENAPHF